MIKHGMHGTPEYNSWEHMIGRCTRPSYEFYHRYGGRGITVCERWRRFENFYADVGPRPSPKHSIDRFPNRNGNYEPGNVRWANPVEQGRNMDHVRLTVDIAKAIVARVRQGATMTDTGKEFGVSRQHVK